MRVNENVNIMGLNAAISYDSEIPGSRELAILEHVSQAAKAAPDCGAKVAGIETMTATCSKTTATVGETITLRATGTGGTPNYTIVFKKGATVLATFSAVPAGTEKTTTYVLVAADVGTQVFSATITDSCPAGAKTCTESCSVTVSAACPLPTCSFTVL